MVFDDADDERWIGPLRVAENVAHSIQRAQIFHRESLIDNDGFWSCRRINIGEVSPLHDLHAHGVKVVCADDVAPEICLPRFDTVGFVTIYKEAAVVVGPA